MVGHGFITALWGIFVYCVPDVMGLRSCFSKTSTAMYYGTLKRVQTLSLAEYDGAWLAEHTSLNGLQSNAGSLEIVLGLHYALFIRATSLSH